jgi:asparagine synthase (glutamine-hydrolysing)
MCGIAGAVGAIGADVVAAVAAASRRQIHRGPDDSGAWQSSASGIGAAFGFRRLAILDLTADGHQPMVDPATGNVIVFNGEIYNYAELRAELAAAGAVFRSRTDTEVILAAYARWGAAAIERLRGMFGLAIWDARRRDVLLARDRLGIKPLYWCEVVRGGVRSLLFASELRSLLATGWTTRRLSRAALDTYVWNGFVVGPDALVDGVRLLPPACTMRVDPASLQCETELYWRLPAAAPQPDGVERLRDALDSSMRQHLVSDVPLGVFLSGGIDSSAVAALAARVAADGAGSVRTFNISFDEAAFDESRFAKAVAAGLGTTHTDIRLTQEHFVGGLDAALAAIDQPTFDGVNSYFVSRAVRDAGVTVALAGTGGDELFGGYRSFREVPRAARVAGRLRWLPAGILRALAAAVVRVKHGRFGAVPPQTRWGKLGDLLATRGDLLAAYQTAYGLFTSDLHGRLLAAPGAGVERGLPRGRAAELRELVDGVDARHGVATLELALFLGERLLRDTDWAGMAPSIEVRVPLLDHVVVEAAAAVPFGRRFEPLGRKQLLRDLGLVGLDPAIFERPKSGFVLPIERWCKERLHGAVDAVLTDRAACTAVGLRPEAVGDLWRAFTAGAPGLYWSRIWSLYVLMRWCAEHRVAV